MKTAIQRFLLVPVTLAILAGAAPRSLRGADLNDEQQFISVLQSGASPQEKDAACVRLKRIGTVKSIPALAGLLTDEQLSDSARYALESMPFPEAGQVLVDALAKTSGQIKLGIIGSLSCRAGEQVSPVLMKLLADSNPDIACAAATALGQIGGPIDPLLEAWSKAGRDTSSSTAPLRASLADALLRCGRHRLANGDRAKALDVFRRLYETEKSDAILQAAYRGMILSSSDNAALTLMTKAIAGKDGPSQIAALRLAHDLPAAGTTKTLVRLLPKINPPAQASLIEGLAQRGDASATEAIARLVDSPAPEVRLAALKALDLVGDGATVPVVTQAAASAKDEAERAAARQALMDMNRGNVTAALLAQLNATPAAQAEAARALGERGDPAAVASLQDLARQGSDSARKAAFQALAELVDSPQLSTLVQLVIDAKGEAARAQAAEALNSACQRLLSWRGRLDAAPLAAGLANDSVQVRAALLPVCSGLSGPETRAALRSAVADANMVLRVAGIRALCDTGDAELLPDVAKVACEAPEENFRVLAIAACTRLSSPEQGGQLSNAQRIAVFEPILKTPLSDEQKRQVLAGLGEISDPQALDLAEPLLGDAVVQAEAAKAVIKIAGSLPQAQSQPAMEALKKVIAAATAPTARAEARAALDEIKGRSGFLTDWQAAGPYTKENKDYAALFDIVFPPEAEDGQRVDWKPLRVGVNPKQPWRMDLLQAFGGEQRVAYARTWIHTDKEQSLRLELGSDDGVKAWLNHKLIHANNVVRAMRPGSDKVDVTLNAGWNELLLKVTQFDHGWAFCARLVKPDGSLPAGLEFDASGEKAK